MPVTPHQPGPRERASVCQETKSNTSEAYLVSDAVFKYSLWTPVNSLRSSRIPLLPQYQVCPRQDDWTGMTFSTQGVPRVCGRSTPFLTGTWLCPPHLGAAVKRTKPCAEAGLCAREIVQSLFFWRRTVSWALLS